MISKLDKYIYVKFFSTFIVTAGVFTLLGIVVDFSEKLQDFVEKGASVNEVLFDYYINFVPFLFSLIGPFFVFIAVVYFTSRMAHLSETTAILASGISYNRLLRPYFIMAVFLASFFYLSNHWLVPETNKNKWAFENQYVYYNPQAFNEIEKTYYKKDGIEKSVMINRYRKDKEEALRVSIRIQKDFKLVSLMRCNKMFWKEEEQHWEIRNALVWEIDGIQDTVYTLQEFDTVFGFTPSSFYNRVEFKDQMNKDELAEFIEQKTLEGDKNLAYFKIEMVNRTANAFSVIILTLLAVAFSTPKKRGGLGLNIALSLILSFLYSGFLRFSSTLATNTNFSIELAAWFPNIIFGIVTLIALRLTPK